MSKSPYGPLSPEEFEEAVNAPFGKAADLLRRHDPLWGKLPKEAGQKIKFRVFCTKQVTMEAFVTVEAEDEEEAMFLASNLKDSEFSWDHSSEESAEVEWAEPK